MDMGVGIDPFIQIEFAGQIQKSEVVNKNNNPIYGVEIKIPFTNPSFANFMKLSVYDHDYMSSDDIVGSTIFAKDKILRHEFKQFYWMNIYGSNVNGSTNYADIMNNQSELGSWWKGRVFLKVDCNECDNPELGRSPMSNNVVQYFVRNPIKIEYQINIELLFGMNFPYNARHSVKVRWGEAEIKFGSTTLYGS